MLVATRLGMRFGRFPRVVPSFLPPPPHISPSSFKQLLFFWYFNLKSHVAKKREVDVDVVQGSTFYLVAWCCNTLRKEYLHIEFWVLVADNNQIKFIANFIGPFDRIYFHRQLNDFVITCLFGILRKWTRRLMVWKERPWRWFGGWFRGLCKNSAC